MNKWLGVSILGLVAFAASAATPNSPPSAGAAGEFRSLRAKMDASKSAANREALPGASIYHRGCETCHSGLAPKAPARTFLEMMTPEAIDRALTVGIMRSEAASLSAVDKRDVATYLSGTPFGARQMPPAPLCLGAAAHFDLHRRPRLVGWGFGRDNDRFIPSAIAQLPTARIPRLKLKWALAYPGAVRARSQPSFAYGALYVGSPAGTVYALDARSGCIRWTFGTTAEVRTPIVVPPMSGAVKRAYFGDIIGRVYAVDAATGHELWQRRVDDHPSATITGAPAFYHGILYVPVSSLEEATAQPSYPCCTFRGAVVALDAATGKVLWTRHTIDHKPRQLGHTKVGTAIFGPAGAAIWNSPTVDPKRGLLYVGTGNNYTGFSKGRSDAVLALDLATGKIVWSRQLLTGDAWNVGCMVGLDSCPPHSGPDSDIGAGTMLATLQDGSQRLLVGMKDGRAIALDPSRRGRVSWSSRIGRGSIQGGIQFGMAFDGHRLYVPISDMANSMDASEKIRFANSGPPHPGLYAVDPDTGKTVWANPADNICAGRKFCDPGILAAITAIPGAVFAGHMDGRLRAYDASTGRVIWQYDTTRWVTTLDGERAHGGSIGGGGPVVHDGIVYANSGYGLYFHMPGNVLLAFSVDGK